MATLRVTTQDPQNRLAAFPLLVPTVQAAIDDIDRYVVMRGTVDVSIVVEPTATGRFAATGDIAFVGRRGDFDVWESALIAESRTGVDPNPDKPDITIYIDPTSSYLAHLWWDPAIASSRAANPPDDRTDAYTVVLHELMHGMGIVGWRNIDTGALPADYRSVWDSLVSVSNGRALFTGAATQALLGQPVEVRLGGSQGAFHLGNGPTLRDSATPWIEQANMNSYYYYDGERYTLGRLELALLQDIGWTLESGITLVDVVNRWDDRASPLYLVGWDRDEQLVGSSLDDRIEGRDGNDVLMGLDGNDRLFGGAGADRLDGGGGRDWLVGGAGDDRIDGGPGLDTVSYGSGRSNYQVAAASGVVNVQGTAGDGRDELVGVERLDFFGGGGLAFDLDGNAGLVARLLGTVFGPEAVRNEGYVDIGLGLVDGGMAPLDVARTAIDARFGAGARDADVVGVLYTNLFGVPPDAAALRSYTELLTSGTTTRASLTLLAAQSDFAAQRVDLVGLAAHGLAYQFTPDGADDSGHVDGTGSGG